MMRKMKIGFVSLAIMLLVGCSKANQDEETMPRKEKPTRVAHEIVATNLEIPWSIQKHQDTFYISERNGTVAVVKDGQVRREKVRLEKPLSNQPEAGLLGFVLMPDFEKRQQAAAYYTYDHNGQTLNAVVILQRNNHEWTEFKTLLEDISSGQYHHGGRLKIGPDEKLYVTTGDGLQEDRAQNLQSLSGKILRLNLDGTIPSDNPFAQSYVYSYGHRNPQGLAWDELGQLYGSEHGPSAHDEINVLEAGANYGWPTIQGDEELFGKVTPIIQSGEETWAPSGMIYHNGYLYIASLRGEAVKRYHIASQKIENIIYDVGRIRDVYIEGNTLYFVSNNKDGRGKPKKEDDHLYKVEL